MAQEVVQHCLTTFDALVANHTYGNAVTMDGMWLTASMIGMWVLIVTDITHTMINIGLQILLFKVFM
ncbi:Hypothetical predicted protein [Paramuricea clavata]|uniref:Uncharacterized protein n=1 Tax=Paramuricea clavata TaxID=317549 RepID=A0A7D9L9W2_PARCT|nr:Hypothetical predicted protein [Paramuricea clavata]